MNWKSFLIGLAVGASLTGVGMAIEPRFETVVLGEIVIDKGTPGKPYYGHLCPNNPDWWCATVEFTPKYGNDKQPTLHWMIRG